MDKVLFRKVFTQSYHSFEVILVDNDSKDNTLEIIKEFPVKLVKFNEEFFLAKLLIKALRLPMENSLFAFLDIAYQRTMIGYPSLSVIFLMIRLPGYMADKNLFLILQI